MRISEAIAEAKKRGSWYNGPTSVSVGFLNNEGNEDETELDVYGENGKSTETELEELWESLHDGTRAICAGSCHQKRKEKDGNL